MLRIHSSSIKIICQFLSSIQKDSEESNPPANKRYNLDSFFEIYDKKITLHKTKYLKMSHL
jgi:hypothetical protein